MYVRRHDRYPTKGFWLRRLDGTETDFSYVDCLTPQSARKDLLDALRVEVADQVVECKRRFFASAGPHLCPVSGVRLGPGNAHVDHAAPRTFDAIAGEWIRARGIDPDTVGIDGYGDGEIAKWLADRRLAQDWQDYHRENATLRVVSQWSNLSTLRKGS